MAKVGIFQLGKKGISENLIKTLGDHFKKNNSVRISVLKSARGEGKKGKDVVKKYSEEIVKKLGEKFTARTIGFVIVVKKWRKTRC